MGTDIIDLDPAKKTERVVLPVSLREANGRLFNKAYSDDIAVACLNLRKLVGTLKESTRKMGITEYDKILDEAVRGANLAWKQYAKDKDPGLAMQTVQAVLTYQLVRFAFDPDFTTLDVASFVGGGK